DPAAERGMDARQLQGLSERQPPVHDGADDLQKGGGNAPAARGAKGKVGLMRAAGLQDQSGGHVGAGRAAAPQLMRVRAARTGGQVIVVEEATAQIRHLGPEQRLDRLGQRDDSAAAVRRTQVAGFPGLLLVATSSTWAKFLSNSLGKFPDPLL